MSIPAQSLEFAREDIASVVGAARDDVAAERRGHADPRQRVLAGRHRSRSPPTPTGRCRPWFSSAARARPIATKPSSAFRSSASSPARSPTPASWCCATTSAASARAAAAPRRHARRLRRRRAGRGQSDRAIARTSTASASPSSATARAAGSPCWRRQRTTASAAVGLVATVGVTGAELNLYQVTHGLERSTRRRPSEQATIDLQKTDSAGGRDRQAAGKRSTSPRLSGGRPTRRGSRAFSTFDPAKLMKDVEQPMLIVQGELDTQVPPGERR